MDVEYLDEYKDSDISNIPDDTNLNSDNDINILAQNKSAMLGNKHNNFKGVLSKKENRYQIKNSSIHIEQAKCARSLKENENTLKESNTDIQKAEDDETNNTNSGKGKKYQKRN